MSCVPQALLLWFSLSISKAFPKVHLAYMEAGAPREAFGPSSGPRRKVEQACKLGQHPGQPQSKRTLGMTMWSAPGLCPLLHEDSPSPRAEIEFVRKVFPLISLQLTSE